LKLYAISDLHVGYPLNRAALEAIPPHPEDWLILCGDIGETVEHLEFVIRVLGARFRQLLWVPGNHELWTIEDEPDRLRGEAKYQRLVALCRDHGVLTPEDPYVEWPAPGSPYRLAPLFLLYDYSFGPRGATPEQALAWALEAGLQCADEHLLHPDPYPTRQAWCHARIARTEPRLEEAARSHRLVLINHFPLRRDIAVLPRIPRFSIWCGTERTHDWHKRFRAEVVVSGHLHIRSTSWIDGVRFEEVSLGYPRQWRSERGPAHYLREILPGPAAPFEGRVHYF
jgi:3',5'-cyclic AMP phosphodiesterase CpdA